MAVNPARASTRMLPQPGSSGCLCIRAPKAPGKPLASRHSTYRARKASRGEQSDPSPDVQSDPSPDGPAEPGTVAVPRAGPGRVCLQQLLPCPALPHDVPMERAAPWPQPARAEGLWWPWFGQCSSLVPAQISAPN